MRWLSFFILAYIALGLQTGLSRAIQWDSATPNFVNGSGSTVAAVNSSRSGRFTDNGTVAKLLKNF